MNQLLYGALAMAAWLAGLFFLRFWRVTRDRLFVFFVLAFWLLALNWLGLGLVPSTLEARHEVYLLRLLAFGLISAGVLDKNRRSHSASN